MARLKWHSYTGTNLDKLAYFRHQFHLKEFELLRRMRYNNHLVLTLAWSQVYTYMPLVKTAE